MKSLPENITNYFYRTIDGEVNLDKFEKWVYTNSKLESILGEDQYLDLISFNFNKKGAKYELVNLLIENYIDLAEYKKWKLLYLLKGALKRNEKLGSILQELYVLYCRGYYFLYDLGLGYGSIVEFPPSKYGVDTWEELKDTEKNEILDSFYPQLQSDIQRVIAWIENYKIMFTAQRDVIGCDLYEDLRTEEERKSTVWIGR